MWFIKAIFGFIIEPISKAYESYNKTKSEYNVLAAEVSKEQIGAQVAADRNAKEIRIATADYPEMRIITFMIAFPFASHLVAVWLDTMFKLGWGVDSFPDPFDEWQGAILLSFFGLKATKSIAKALAWGLARR